MLIGTVHGGENGLVHSTLARGQWDPADGSEWHPAGRRGSSLRFASFQAGGWGLEKRRLM